MKYQMRPQTVDALQWTGQNHREMFNFLERCDNSKPMDSCGEHFRIDHNAVPGGLVIRNTDGDEWLAFLSDYIVRNADGTYCPYRKSWFESMYEHAKCARCKYFHPQFYSHTLGYITPWCLRLTMPVGEDHDCCSAYEEV